MRVTENHLLDRMNRSLRDLRISVTDRCNFRCTYCMPEEKYHRNFQFLKTKERLDFAEIVRLAGLFTAAGVRKLRITGGEPLLRPALGDLIGDLRALPNIEEIALTTNGILLGQHAAGLKAAGLDRVTVSLDALDKKVFKQMTGGRGGLGRILDGIDAALEADLTPIKINAVVQRGVNDDSMMQLLERFRGTGVIVRMIEYMDVGNINHWQESDTVPSAELRARIGERWPLRAERSNYDGEVATRHLYEDGEGEIGFISSVSEPFCGSCHRARLSSDGQLFTCLFAAAGTDLRQPMRDGATDEELFNIIHRVWARRADRYSEQRAELLRRGRAIHKPEMYYIGG
ncbi:MAG: GTP 3',8-cyclase MoaA [Gammaproteobacteria bacterium]|jgi:cyclic pyranopterin phosphate synthase|nr:GTP 3',8-cyclase MoaA [Gammaproteobacteria bacterium]